jgi:hypothetical protein
MDLETIFRQALEKSVMTLTSWRIAPQNGPAHWILQGSIQHYEIKGIAFSKIHQGAPSRVEVIVAASIELRDGQTGILVQCYRDLTFRRQCQVDSIGTNYSPWILNDLAQDFADAAVMLIIVNK